MSDNGSGGSHWPTGGMEDGAAQFPNVFAPIRIGPMHLRNRIMLPPHASAIGNFVGAEREFDKVLAYCVRRAKAGAGWFCVLNGGVANHFIPGFEHPETSANEIGTFRLTRFVRRARQFVDALHAHDARVSCQVTLLGGMPNAPSNILAQPTVNGLPHVLRREEIAFFVEEYRIAAERMREAGFDGIEIHMNHEDLTQQFLSPFTNRRDDEYGGSRENRCRFIIEVLSAIRGVVGNDMALGVRMNMEEPPRRGYDVTEGIEIARLLEASGLIDYIHTVEGTTWGNPSYIQGYPYDAGGWMKKSRQYKQALSLPVIHSGSINAIELAEQVIATGCADMVGMARAFMAEPDIIRNAIAGHSRRNRPCTGLNECINRRSEGLVYGCAANPHTGYETEGAWPRAARPRKLLVIGGGPAGMELAAIARRSGHEVELWEARDQLGGAMRIAIRAPRYDKPASFINWQAEQLDRLRIPVRLGRIATVDTVLAHGADVVAVATGAEPWKPDIEGIDQPHVLDINDVLLERARPGKRVLVIARDDHMPPLAVADFLSERGHDVTMTYGTAKPAQVIGKYLIGGPLGRLDAKGVAIRCMEDVTRIGPDHVIVRNIYSEREDRIEGIDSIVIASTGQAGGGLFYALKAQGVDSHILGDAFAPRRMVYATKQARALARLL